MLANKPYFGVKTRYDAEFWRNCRCRVGLWVPCLCRDMRTRFGRSSLSYLIAVAWPLGHILAIMGGYLLVTSFAPVGDDPAVFLATGMLPYILCLYPARQLAYALAQNRQLLSIPVLRPIHLIAARLVLELTTAALVCIIFYAALIALGIDIWPSDVQVAAEALCATLYLAIGLGFLNVVIIALFGPFALVGFILVMVGLYVTSGIYLPVRMVPEPTRSIMAYWCASYLTGHLAGRVKH